MNGTFDWLTVLAIVGVVVAASLGGYFVQNAYSSGSADLVIAGLTVVDPIVAVGIGVIVLGEASGAPWCAVLGFVVAAAHRHHRRVPARQAPPADPGLTRPRRGRDRSPGPSSARLTRPSILVR